MLVVWSNIGYFEVVVKVVVVDIEGLNVEDFGERKIKQLQFIMIVVGVNVLCYFEGLKKIKGGIGSVQFDKRQRIMDLFFGFVFKKQRVD